MEAMKVRLCRNQKTFFWKRAGVISLPEEIIRGDYEGILMRDEIRVLLLETVPSTPKTCPSAKPEITDLLFSGIPAGVLWSM